MTTTTNYGYNVIDGSDQVNIQTQIAPNFTAIDSDLKDVSDAAITTATHTLAGTVHQLVRDDADRAVIRFVATADMATGDTFTVDGVTVTARLVNGEALQTGSFKINNCVECVLVGSVLNVNAVNPTVSVASDVTYDNTGSGLTATNVQDAIDEVKGDIPSIPASYAATAITYNNTLSGLTATDVQFAIDEVNAKIAKTGITVTTDGVQTYKQLFNQIFAQIDLTKVTNDSLINLFGGVLRIENISPSALEFAKARNSMSSWNIQTITLSSDSTMHNISSGTYTDSSNSIPGPGNTITFVY